MPVLTSPHLKCALLSNFLAAVKSELSWGKQDGCAGVQSFVKAQEPKTRYRPTSTEYKPYIRNVCLGQGKKLTRFTELSISLNQASPYCLDFKNVRSLFILGMRDQIVSHSNTSFTPISTSGSSTHTF